MNLFADALAWIFSPERLTGSLPLPVAIAQHLGYTAIATLIAAVIAVPLGWYIGHTGRGKSVAVAVSGIARAIPSLGLVVLLVLLIGVAFKAQAAIVAFVLLAIPSLLAGAYTGIEAIDRKVLDAASAVGMTPFQVFWRVEVPLGLPLLLGGVRAAVLQVVATVAIAAYVGLGGVGFFVLQGIPLNDFAEVLGASLVIVVIAIVLDAVFALITRFATPAGVRKRTFRPTPNQGESHA